MRLKYIAAYVSGGYSEILKQGVELKVFCSCDEILAESCAHM